MTLLEVRPRVPPRPRHQVIHPILVQVPEACALAPELIAQLDALERVELLRARAARQRRRTRDDGNDRDEMRHRCVPSLTPSRRAEFNRGDVKREAEPLSKPAACLVSGMDSPLTPALSPLKGEGVAVDTHGD